MIDLYLQALIGLSTSCEQSIIHKCSTNILTGYSSWIGSTGIRNTYWHGDQDPSAKGCACSLDKSCSKISHETSCNCDSQMQNMIDVGTLTSMKQLPVMQLNYGGAYTTISSIAYDLGPLKCTGTRLHIALLSFLAVAQIGPQLWSIAYGP